MAKTTFEIDIETANAIKSAKDLREQFNILEDKMFELAKAGKEGTKEFQAIRNALASTKERIDDLNESIDMLKPEAKFQAFANLGAGIANGFAAAQGAAQLFGSESEALNESLVKVQSAMAVAQGLQGLAGMGQNAATAMGNAEMMAGTNMANASQQGILGQGMAMANRDAQMGNIIGGGMSQIGGSILGMGMQGMGSVPKSPSGFTSTGGGQYNSRAFMNAGQSSMGY